MLLPRRRLGPSSKMRSTYSIARGQKKLPKPERSTKKRKSKMIRPRRMKMPKQKKPKQNLMLISE